MARVFGRRVLLHKNARTRYSRLRPVEGDRTPISLSSSLLKREDELVNNRVSIVKVGGGVSCVLCDGDILVVPDMILYRGLHESDIEAFLDYVIGHGAPSTSAIQLEIREKEAPKQVPKEAKEAEDKFLFNINKVVEHIAS